MTTPKSINLLPSSNSADVGSLPEGDHHALPMFDALDGMDPSVHLASLLHTLTDMVWFKNDQHVYLICNAAFAALVGRDRNEILGHSDFELFPSELAVFFRGRDADAVAAGAACSNEEWMEHVGLGQRMLLEVRRFPVRSAGGGLLGVLGIARDITASRDAHHKLREALDFAESVISAQPDILLEVDRDGRHLRAWSRDPEVLGDVHVQLIGRTVDEVLDPQAASMARKGLAHADIHGISRNINVMMTKEGERHWYDVSVAKRQTAGTEETTFVVHLRDVTEFHLMQQELRRREQEFRSLVEHSPDSIGRYGPDLRRLYVNPALGRALGSTPERLVGETVGEGALPPVWIERYRRHLLGVFETGCEAQLELLHTDDAGTEHCVLVRSTPEVGDHGEVTSVLSVGRDVSELHDSRKRMHQLAFYDALTGLPNRTLLGQRLDEALDEVRRNASSMGLMLIDMDRFKTINDTLGHGAGDALLHAVAARLSTCVRSYDTVARLGGDEFAVVLPKLRQGDNLAHIADKVLKSFVAPFSLEGHSMSISCSIGVAVYPNDGTNAGELLKNADTAMYAAKQAGRDAFRFYERKLTDDALRQFELQSELRHALKLGEFELHYQPKVDMTQGMVVGSEALLRWRHPARGMVSPGEFIPVAEDLGLIVDIGRWVLREACQVAATKNLSRTGPDCSRHWTVAVNLSPRQFDQPTFVCDILATLRETGCEPKWVELEITESLLLEDGNATLAALQALRQAGLSIAIDDFGTGYSALSYLMRYPIDTLKIDQSFVRNVDRDAQNGVLVRAILRMAHELGLNVVAEGIETNEQADCLLALGCRLGQGYLYGRPEPVTR